MDKSNGTSCDFEPQQWRRSKCKHCFQDFEVHLGISRDDDLSYSKPDNADNKSETFAASHLRNEQGKGDSVEASDREVSEITKKAAADDKGIEREAKIHAEVESVIENFRVYDGNVSVQMKTEVEISERSDSFLVSRPYDEDSPLVPRKYSLDAGGLLSRSSCVDFSSTSSLASFDALEDNTLSSYSYNGSRENLDGFASGDELCFQGLSPEKQMLISSEKITLSCEEQLENLQDKVKALERDKDHVIQALDRELQGLKLELTKYSARENITILKNRLELEGKNQAIQELQEEVEHLRITVDDLSLNKDSEETQYERLLGEVKRRNRRVQCLEEEKKTLEERLSLAEDLQENDRDLLDVLRNQLTALEGDLLSSEDRNKQLEREAKSLRAVETEFLAEKEVSKKLRKHVDFLNGKLKLREQHVSFLEEDNVKMQQEKVELETKFEKDREKIERLNSVVKELKKDIQMYNKEIEQLSEENSQLEQAHWQAVVNRNDASGQLESYIKDLETRANHGYNKIKELEAENESLVKQASEMLENLVMFQEELEESKRLLDTTTENYNRLQSMKTDQDKRMMTMQRKLKKLQKEKKRFQIEKQEADEKILMLRMNDDKVSSKCDDIEKGYKMLQLKLQSTEAKLTMVERNKIYMESKLQEYESKFKCVDDKISNLNCVVIEYLEKIGQNDLLETGVDGIDSFGIHLSKIFSHNDHVLSELRSCAGKNNELLRVVDLEEKRIEKFGEYLELAEREKETLKCQLEESKYDCDKLHDSFLTSVSYLAQQNNVLEEKLIEMRELESVLTSYEDTLHENTREGIEEDKTEADLNQPNNIDDSGIESLLCQHESTPGNVNRSLCQEIEHGKITIETGRIAPETRKIVSETGRKTSETGRMTYGTGKFVPITGSFKSETGKETCKTGKEACKNQPGDSEMGHSYEDLSASSNTYQSEIISGKEVDPKSTFAQNDYVSVGEKVVMEFCVNENTERMEISEVELKNIDKKDYFLRVDASPDEITCSEDEFSAAKSSACPCAADKDSSDSPQQPEQGPVSIYAGGITEETPLVTADLTELNTSDIQGGPEEEKVCENESVFSVTLPENDDDNSGMLDCKPFLENDANISNGTDIGSSINSAKECNMDDKRPLTSITCVFQVETDYSSSLIDYSERAADRDIISENACSPYKLDKDTEVVGGDWGYSNYGFHDDSLHRKNERREERNTDLSGSYFSVAASDIGFCQYQAEIPQNSSLTARKDSGSTTNGHKLSIGKLFQISQDSGAITLTIPATSLEDDNEEEFEDDVNTSSLRKMNDQQNDETSLIQSHLPGGS